jgi:hypothetical protein
MTPTALPVSVRFHSKIHKAANGCWHWTGTIQEKTGYGTLFMGTAAEGNRRNVSAHRYAYELATGIPLTAKRGEPGHLQVDHECHNRSASCPGGPTCMHRRCVNPAHLRAVPARVNIMAGKTPAARNAAATHCKRGHAFTSDNTYMTKRGQRQCRRCQIDQSVERNRRLAQARGPIPHYRTLKTHCTRGHPYSGDNLVVDAKGHRGCRECQRLKDRAHYNRNISGPNRGPLKNRTHCIHGHEFTPENTYVPPGKPNSRACKACQHLRRARQI